MIVLPISTPVLTPNDNIVDALKKHADIRAGDIVVISSKAIAMCEGAAISLKNIDLTDQAQTYAKQTNRSPEFMQAVLHETERLHGRVLGTTPLGAALTEVSPAGLNGAILCPNAGLDESNIDKGFAIGWPVDPVASAQHIREAFDQNIGVIISDSCCHVRRWGVSAYALTVAGFDPFKSEIGNKDLFDHDMRVTVEARADQLATTANHVMGNGGQSIPAAIIRQHNIPLTDFAGWVKGMNKEEDLFSDLFKQ